MKHRLFAASAALTLSLVSLSPALAATPAGNPPYAKVKQVSFAVRNDSAAPVTLQAGDQQVTLAPGKQGKIKAPEGTPLTTVNATPMHPAGDQVGTVTSALGGNTLIIR